MEIKISSIIKEELFHVDVDPFRDKEELFDTCARWLAEENVVKDIQQLKEALYHRESIGSTYLGNYIALPHAKGVSVEYSSVLFCRTKSPFMYQSNDEEGEVKYIFMLIIPENETNDGYIHILASIAKLLTMDEFTSKLDGFKNAEDFINCALEVREGEEL